MFSKCKYLRQKTENERSVHKDGLFFPSVQELRQHVHNLKFSCSFSYNIGIFLTLFCIYLLLFSIFFLSIATQIFKSRPPPARSSLTASCQRPINNWASSTFLNT